MGVPLRTCAAVKLHEAHAALDHAPGEEAHSAHRGGVFVLHAVERLGRVGLMGQVHRVGGLRLHAEGQLIRADSRIELRQVGVRALVLLV